MLTNDRVLGVDQDAVAAKRIVNSGSQQVFSKKESSGAYVVALFNTRHQRQPDGQRELVAGRVHRQRRRHRLWSGSHTGTVANSYSATLRPGESRLIRVVPGSGSGTTTSYEAEAGGNTIAGSTRTASCSACSGGTKVGYIGNGAAPTT